MDVIVPNHECVSVCYDLISPPSGRGGTHPRVLPHLAKGASKLVPAALPPVRISIVNLDTEILPIEFVTGCPAIVALVDCCT